MPNVSSQFPTYILYLFFTIVRLVGGAISGSLDVLRGGIWGPLCGDGLDWRTAAVVCRQLLLPGAEVGQAVPISDGRAFTNSIACDGHENNVGECSESDEDIFEAVCETQASVICGKAPLLTTFSMI